VAELAFRQPALHSRTEQIVQDEGEEEVYRENPAPDAGDPLDEPFVAGEDVDREDEQHHGDEDGEVLQELHAPVGAVMRFALEHLFLGGGFTLVFAAPGTTSHCDASFQDLN